MKILYISPEHVSGTLALFKREHERRGDECRFVTFWHSRWDFEDDICLDLRAMPNQRWVHALRGVVGNDPHANPSRIINGKLPEWRPGTIVRGLHTFRDALNWPRIRRAIDEFGLNHFDVIHLDGGMDFTRDARFARAMKVSGKKIVCYYHGSDLRSRGFIPEVEKLCDLRFTPEWDLAALDDRLNYLYLPVDISRITAKPYAPGERVRICHASRNPQKGTPIIVDAVRSLAKSLPLELVLIDNLPHNEALRTKASCDIYIDQLTNEGGWGYGMSGVEALAMGLPVVTNIPKEMLRFVGEHPFVHAEPSSIQSVLAELVKSAARCQALSIEGRAWVEARHDVRKVADVLYSHYDRLGWRT